MNGRTRCLAAAVALVATGCAGPQTGLTVSATVDDTTESLTVPYLVLPAVNLDGGFAGNSGERNPVTGRTASRSSSVASTLGLGSTMRVTSVKVSEGEMVRAGQIVATLDSALARAALASAKADATAAATQPRLLADAIAQTYDKQADIADARRKIEDAITKIHKTTAELRRTRSTLNKALPMVKRGLSQIEKAISSLPPGVPTPPELAKNRAKLTAQLKKINSGLKKISSALTKLSSGLRQARSGQKRLNDAEAKITDARDSLRDLKKLAELQADAMEVPVEAARIQIDLTSLAAPVDGVVVSLVAAGDELAPNATVASFRRSGPSSVTAWLPPARLGEVCVGDSASITSDWSATAIPATLSHIGTRADYPPTSVATDEVHLTRAVEVKLSAASALPAGAPVEVRIQGCHLAAEHSVKNG